MSTAEQPFRWRTIVLPALLPTLLFSIGEGAILPMIPRVAEGLGATLAIAGLVAAVLMIGELVGNIPSGWLVARIGERPAMIGGALTAMVGAVICLIAPNTIALAFGLLLVGLAAAVFSLARHAFLTSFVPLSHRARALSTLGGTFRLGFLVGPFITAALIELTGMAAYSFWILITACALAVIVLVTLPDPTTTFGAVSTVRLEGRRMREGEALAAKESSGLWRTLVTKRGVLARLGLGAALMGALRSSRQVILPLWAVSIGVSETSTAIIIGIAGGIDFALFYTGGYIMDRFGRLAAALPAMLGLAAGHFVLAVTHDLPSNVEWFVVAAVVLALANGPGSGILMTLGSDLADKRNPAPFLGAWRFTGGLGGAAAPVLIAAITAASAIAPAAAVMGVLGIIGAGIFTRYVPRYVPRPGGTGGV